MRLPYVLWKLLSVICPSRTPHQFKLYCIPTVESDYPSEQTPFWALGESPLIHHVMNIYAQNTNAVIAVYDAMPDSWPGANKASSLVAYALNTTVRGQLSENEIDGLYWSGTRYTSSLANSLRRMAVVDGVTVVIIVMKPNDVNLLLNRRPDAPSTGTAIFVARSARKDDELRLKLVPTV